MVSIGNQLLYLTAFEHIVRQQETTPRELRLPHQFGVHDLIGRHPLLYGRGDVDTRGVDDQEELRLALLRFSRGGEVAHQDYLELSSLLELYCRRDILMQGDEPGMYRLPTGKPTFTERCNFMRASMREGLRGEAAGNQKSGGALKFCPPRVIDPTLPFAYLVLNLVAIPQLHPGRLAALTRTLCIIARIGTKFTFGHAREVLVGKEDGAEFAELQLLRDYLLTTINRNWLTYTPAGGRSRELIVDRDKYVFNIKALPVLLDVP